MEYWSSKWKWVDRARAWDDHIQSQKDQASISEARKWQERAKEARDRNYAIGKRLQDRANELLDHPTTRSTTEGPDGSTVIVEPAGWGQRDVALIAKHAAELIDSALGPKATEQESRDLIPGHDDRFPTDPPAL